MTQRALLVSHHFSPENVPATLHPKFFFKYLPEFGVQVDVLTSSFSPFDWDPMTAPAEPQVRRYPLGSDIDTMKFLHRWETFFGHHLSYSDWGRCWIPYAVAEGARMMRANRYDAVISFSPPFTSHRVALRLKQRFPELKWFAYLADPFVENPFNPANPLQIRLNRRLERQVFENATGVIANTATMQSRYEERYPDLADKFSYIPNGFDLDEPVGPKLIPQERTTPVLIHAGGLYGARFPKLLLESIQRLHTAGSLSPKDLHLHLVGSVAASSVNCPELFDWARKLNFVSLGGRLSRHEALQHTAEADYLLLIDLNEKNTKFQVPSKLFDYLRIGRPILCYTPRGSETEAILLRTGIPNVIIGPDASPAEADEGLIRFLKMSSAPVPMSDWALKTFDARAMTERLASMLNAPRSGSPMLERALPDPAR